MHRNMNEIYANTVGFSYILHKLHSPNTQADRLLETAG
jgi:hypothetical protein